MAIRGLTLADLKGISPRESHTSKLDYTHRFSGSAVYELDGLRFYATHIPLTIAAAQDDRYVAVPEAGYRGRLDLLANEHYGTPDLDWLIAEANNIIDPFEDMRPGMVLRIPTVASLLARGIFQVR